MKRVYILFVFLSMSLFATDIQIWTRSQCPYCVMAENAMLEALARIPEGQRPNIEQNYIMKYDAVEQRLVSMHGQSEVDENIRRMVIEAYFPENYHEYISSRNTHWKDTLWAMDAHLADIDTTELKLKIMEHGEIMAMEHALRTEKERVDASPTLFVDGEKLMGWGYDMPSIYIALINLGKHGGIPGLPTCDEHLSKVEDEIKIGHLIRGCRP